MADLLQQARIEVSTSGELVVLALGNFGATMHFADALKVAFLLLRDGRIARRAAVGRLAMLVQQVRAMGSMSDATAEKVAPSRWNRALPERYSAREIFTRVDGAQVQLRFRNTTATLDYDAALTISQWLRVRGKQARNSVNESASWDKIAQG